MFNLMRKLLNKHVQFNLTRGLQTEKSLMTTETRTFLKQHVLLYLTSVSILKREKI